MARYVRASNIARDFSYLLIICLLPGNFIDAASIGNSVFRSDLCDSPIYCNGELLKTVQLARIFNDSKDFVDHYQLNDPDVTLANFAKLMTETGGNPNSVEIKRYVTENFDRQNELVDWALPDWQENPAFLDDIEDVDFRQWAKDLNEIWKTLAKKIAPTVFANPDRHSLITVDNGFVVPGGRFQEFYYWDSYWVIEGLLLTGMKNTSRGMIENFFSMVNRYGFIPNGGRVYYLMRSQPPLLIPMVELYLEHTGDVDFMLDNLATLEKEFAYFHREKTVSVTKNGICYKMARYIVSSDGPRPESYWEDYKLAENLPSETERKQLYENLKAGAESGWDFSSRWFISPDGGVGNLSQISTKDIIPVDLNAFLQRNARLLSTYNIMAGKIVKAKYYRDIAAEYQRGIDKVLWNEEEGIWLDYDIKNNRPRNNFYPTNLSPLYTKSYDHGKTEAYAKKAVAYLKKNKISEYMGGTPSSLSNTGEQWDLPNAWPPLQSIMIQGLQRTKKEPATSLAAELGTRWLRANYIGFLKSGQMYEKYDAEIPGEFGDGGEYVPQKGFGWTNGVVLEFLESYPDATSSDALYESEE